MEANVEKLHALVHQLQTNFQNSQPLIQELLQTRDDLIEKAMQIAKQNREDIDKNIEKLTLQLHT